MDQQRYADEIDPVEYIKVIYKHRVLIIMVIFVGMIFAAIFSFSNPAMYEASATFFPLNVNVNQSSQSLGLVRKLNIEDLIISLLESRNMADKIIEQLDLKKTWNISSTAEARNILKGMTSITFEKNGIIKLAVIDISPELSAGIVNAYVDSLERLNGELDLGVQRKIVQVIDRAVVPERRMPRGIKKNTILAGVASLVFGILLAFIIEFFRKIDLRQRLKEQ